MMIRIVSAVVMVTLALVCAGPAIAAEGGGGMSWDWWKLLWRCINAAVLIGILVYLLKGPLVRYFSERRENIRKELEEAKAARNAAEAQLREYEQKLAGMEAELEKMRADMKKAADAESEKVVANAERMSEAIVESAKVTAEQEVRKARTRLKNEAVDMAMQMAEALIQEKISAEDQQKILEDYLVRVGGQK
jgi:F-type H+-transporting ATPase subunit b